LRQVREFFAARQVLEVETPLLQQHPASDLHLESIPCEPERGAVAFLPTSPELAMKRLLAAGSGPIFQICKAFRQGELGTRHQPEFSILEWYRPGFSLDRMQEEVDELVRAVLADQTLRPSRTCTYAGLWTESLGLEPHTCSDSELRRSACALLPNASAALPDLDRDALLGLMMSELIEPQLPRDQPVFVHQFPSSSAAMARLVDRGDGIEVAARFELFLGGLELANAYQELTDPAEQQMRLASDVAQRAQQGRVGSVDRRFVAALEQGLPPCCGVALGIDRLLMIAAGVESIDQVISFAWRD
jgi:lysyl-tRNA synthetase class 2